MDFSSLIQYKPREETNAIIIHDSHTVPSEHSWSRDAKDGALRIGLIATGYHYIIEQDGVVEVTREDHLWGTHTATRNHDSIGICLVGGRSMLNTPEDNFTAQQKDMLMLMINSLMEKYGELEILGHYEAARYYRKAHARCPAIDMDDIRQEWEIYKLLKKGTK